jgi:hypothetical protein
MFFQKLRREGMANRLERGGLDVSGAVSAVKRASMGGAESAAESAEASLGGVKFVNLRFRESDYQRIGRLAVSSGMTRAGFCKMAALYVAEMAESGAFSVGGGGVIDRTR